VPSGSDTPEGLPGNVRTDIVIYVRGSGFLSLQVKKNDLFLVFFGVFRHFLTSKSNVFSKKEGKRGLWPELFYMPGFRQYTPELST